MEKITLFQQKVYGAVRRVPRGCVSTYTDIARLIGKPRAVRAVGNALNQNHSSMVPCHRVIRSDGSVGGFARGTRAKTKLLHKEGVQIHAGKIDPHHILSRF